MIRNHRRRRTLFALVACCLALLSVRFGARGIARAEDADDYDQIIEDFAKKYHVEAALVKAVIRAESDFDPDAVSPRGARGLMQLMPRIARTHGVADPYDPRQNIRGGVRVLRSLLDRFGHDPRLALAAYNAGGHTVRRYRGLPPYRETRDYVRKVLRYREWYLNEDARDRDDVATATAVAVADPPRGVRPRKMVRPRGAETIWYGAPLPSDGTFLAAFHSSAPETPIAGAPAIP